jgi:hypothetical protein
MIVKSTYTVKDPSLLGCYILSTAQDVLIFLSSTLPNVLQSLTLKMKALHYFIIFHKT